MKNKKIIKLINNERMSRKILANKACDTTSTDMCIELDYAQCIVNSYDVCIKDLAGCYYGSEDYCTNIDTSPCGNGINDHS